MTQRDRIVLIVVGVLAATAASWMLVVQPKRSQAADLAAEVTKAEQARDKALTDAAGAEQAKARYAKDYATVAGLGKAVPANDDVPSLVYQLQAAAKRAGLDFRSLQIDTNSAAAAAAATAAAGTDAAAVPNGGGLTKIPVNLTFDGELGTVRRFLSLVRGFASATESKLDVSGRFLTVDGLALTQGRGGFPRVKAEVAVTAFQAPLSAVGTAAGPQNAAATTTPSTGEAASGSSAPPTPTATANAPGAAR